MGRGGRPMRRRHPRGPPRYPTPCRPRRSGGVVVRGGGMQLGRRDDRGWTVMGQTQSPAHNDGTGTTRGGGRGGCRRRRRLSTAPAPPEAGVCVAPRERRASAARAHRASARARQHAAASRARQKPEFSRARVRRRGRAAQLDAPRPSRSTTRRGSTPHAARGGSDSRFGLGWYYQYGDF